jgi:hypothetical protein
LSDIRQKLFQFRSYTPFPFLFAMVLFARPTATTLAAGFVLTLLGESIRFWGVAYAGSLTRVTGSVGAPDVVIAGPFSYVRNPLYIGNILMYTGVGVMANALTPWLVLVALVYFSVQYSLIVSLEEEFLEKEFGDGYIELAGSGAIGAAHISGNCSCDAPAPPFLELEVGCGPERNDHSGRSFGRSSWIRGGP